MKCIITIYCCWYCDVLWAYLNKSVNTFNLQIWRLTIILYDIEFSITQFDSIVQLTIESVTTEKKKILNNTYVLQVICYLIILSTDSRSNKYSSKIEDTRHIHTTSINKIQ